MIPFPRAVKFKHSYWTQHGKKNTYTAGGPVREGIEIKF